MISKLREQIIALLRSELYRPELAPVLADKILKLVTASGGGQRDYSGDIPTVGHDLDGHIPASR
jgi:hypothetical protein